MSADKELCQRVECIVRPIVEGQIRGFLKEHPAIVDAVDWYKPRSDKATTFVNSLAKRIVRDLACGTSTARLAAAVLAIPTEPPRKSSVEGCYCGDGGALGMRAARPANDNRPAP